MRRIFSQQQSKQQRMNSDRAKSQIVAVCVVLWDFEYFESRAFSFGCRLMPSLNQLIILNRNDAYLPMSWRGNFSFFIHDPVESVDWTVFCLSRAPQMCVQIECLYLHNYSRWRYTQPFRNYSMTTELQVQIWIDGYCIRLAASYHYLVCSLLNNDCCRRLQWRLFGSALRLWGFTHTHISCHSSDLMLIILNDFINGKK